MDWLTEIIAQIIDAGGTEIATDKKGREFHRAVLTENIMVRKPALNVKSLVWYVGENHVRILANVSKTRNGKTSHFSINEMIKVVDDDFVVIVRNKKGAISPRRGLWSYEHVVNGKDADSTWCNTSCVERVDDDDLDSYF